jgi:hypothetical protein
MAHDPDPIIPPQGLAQISGARSDRETIDATIAGATAPNVLSFDPRSAHHDELWCQRLRNVWLNGEPLTDVVSFDIPRGQVEILLRDERGKELHEYVGEAWDPMRDPWPTGRLVYSTAIRVGERRCTCGCGQLSHVSVAYGIPVKR